MESEQRFEILLNTNRVEIVERLDLERTFLFDYLLSKSVFDKNDRDLVNAKPTREGKASKFLDVLETKGPEGLEHFVNALQLLNPSLYELVTGEKASTKPSPIINGFSFCESNSVDLEILSTYAKRVSGDMQNMTIQYERVLKEKEQLQRALRVSEEKINEEKRQNEQLQHKISETEEMLEEGIHRKTRDAKEQLEHRIRCIHEDSDMKQFIIQLQMRLLAAHDENENMMRQMIYKLEQVDRSSAKERRETFRISQKLISQSEEIKNFRENHSCTSPLASGCPHVQELKFEMLKQRDEMKDLKDWTEALKVKYDIAMEERDEVLGIREDLTRDCTKLMEELSQLKIKLNRANREGEDLKRNCKELEENAAAYRKQRDIHEREMKDALIKRDQAARELDENTRRYKEELDFKERTIRLQTGDERTFEKQCKEFKTELNHMREELRDARQENDELCNQVDRLQARCAQTFANGQTEANSDRGEPETDETPFASQYTDDTDGNTELAKSWEERNTSATVESIKRRLCNNKRPKETRKTRASFRPGLIRKSRSMDEQISELVPAIEQLSPEAKKAFSLNRRQPKKALPYKHIIPMYPDTYQVPYGRQFSQSDPYDTAKAHPCAPSFARGSLSDNALDEFSSEELDEEEPQCRAQEYQRRAYRPRSRAFNAGTRPSVVRRANRRPSEESQELSD